MMIFVFALFVRQHKFCFYCFVANVTKTASVEIIKIIKSILSNYICVGLVLQHT